MEEQPSWKSHAFTLMVFAGIVVLCAIFFTLGMLVGRTQEQKNATLAADTVKVTPKETAKDEHPEFTFDESVNKKQPPPLEPLKPPPPSALEPDPEARPAVSATPAAAAQPKASKPVEAPPTAAVNAVNFQVAALSNSKDADKLVAKLKTQGFRAFILDPLPTDHPPHYRVQVGPVSGSVEEESLRQRLQTAGFPHPILKQ